MLQHPNASFLSEAVLPNGVLRALLFVVQEGPGRLAWIVDYLVFFVVAGLRS